MSLCVFSAEVQHTEASQRGEDDEDDMTDRLMCKVTGSLTEKHFDFTMLSQQFSRYPP